MIQLLLLLFAVTAAAQTTTFSGRVTSIGGTPMAKTTVTLIGPPEQGVAPAFVEVTDAEGAFAARDLPPGDYTLRAERYGYRIRPDLAVRFTLTAGTSARVDVVMEPLGVITGLVTDQDGNLLQGITVVLHRDYGDGATPRIAIYQSVRSDDRGRFRIAQIPPGDYFLEASGEQRSRRTAGEPGVIQLGPRARRVNLATFYPDAAEIAGAQPIPVGIGDTKTVDVRMRQGGSYRVRVQLEGGQPERFATVNLWRQQDPRRANDLLRADRIGDGVHEAQNVPPGTYRLLAVQGNSPQEWSASDAVEVTDQDVTDVAVRLRPPFPIEGRFLFEGELPPGITFRMQPTEPINAWTITEIQVEPDGTFRIQNVPARQFGAVMFYQVPFAGMQVKSIRVGGREITRESVIDLTSGASERWEVELGRSR